MSEPLQWERKDGHDYVASVELGDNTLTAVIDVKEDHFFWHVDTVRAYLDMGSSENAGRAATLAEAKREAAESARAYLVAMQPPAASNEGRTITLRFVDDPDGEAFTDFSLDETVQQMLEGAAASTGHEAAAYGLRLTGGGLVLDVEPAEGVFLTADEAREVAGLLDTARQNWKALLEGASRLTPQSTVSTLRRMVGGATKYADRLDI